MPYDKQVYAALKDLRTKNNAATKTAVANAASAMAASEAAHAAYFDVGKHENRDSDGNLIVIPPLVDEMNIAMSAEDACCSAKMSADASSKLIADMINEYDSDDDRIKFRDPKIEAAKVAAAVANKAAQKAAEQMSNAAYSDIARDEGYAAVAAIHAARKAVNKSFLASSAVPGVCLSEFPGMVGCLYNASESSKMHTVTTSLYEEYPQNMTDVLTSAVADAAAAAEAAEAAAAACGMRMRRTNLVLFKCLADNE
jgi:hypothetical protein